MAAMRFRVEKLIRDKLPADARGDFETIEDPAELARRAALARDYLKGARA